MIFASSALRNEHVSDEDTPTVLPCDGGAGRGEGEGEGEGKNEGEGEGEERDGDDGGGGDGNDDDGTTEAEAHHMSASSKSASIICRAPRKGSPLQSDAQSSATVATASASSYDGSIAR